MFPPLLRPKYIQTFLPANDHIRSTSVLEVENVEDLQSNKLGVTDWEHACLTCGCFLSECPGHSGSLELPVPVYRIFFVKRLIQILNCVCFYCQRIRLPKSDPRYNTILNLPRQNRLEYLLKASVSFKVCERHVVSEPMHNHYEVGQLDTADISSSEEKTDNSHLEEEEVSKIPALELSRHGCGKSFIQFRHEDRFSTYIRAIVVLDQSDLKAYDEDPGWRPFVVEPTDIYQMLKHIGPEAREMLGCDKWNLPESLMWSVINIPSLNTRPCHTFAGLGASKKFTYSDWTKMLRNILLARNQLRDMIPHTSEQISCCHYKFEKVEAVDYREAFRVGRMDACPDRTKAKAQLKLTLFSLNQIGGLEGAWRHLMSTIAAFHSYRHKNRIQQGTQFGKPLSNVEDRYRGQKAARFRANIVARRTNNTGRGVLEGHMNMQVNEVGIPKTTAYKLTIKVHVNHLNMQQAAKWIVNGPYNYPGANYVTLKTGEEINLMFYENLRDIHVEDVLFVRRHLQTGDDLLVGRQPTLHRPSMMTFKCRIIPHYAVRLHFAVFTPMGADCDGDEVYFQTAQSLNAAAELQGLSSVGENVMKDGKVWIKFIQNAIVGAYILTDPDRFITFDQMQHLTKDLTDLWEYPKPLTVGDDGEPLYSGNQILSLILPDDFTLTRPGNNKDDSDDLPLVIRNGKFLQGRLNANSLNGPQGILSHMYRDYRDRKVTLRFLHYGYLMFQNMLDLYGHSAGFYDCAIDRLHVKAARRSKSEALSDVKTPFTSAIIELEKVKKNVDALEEYAARFTHHTPDSNDTAVELSLREHVDKLTQMSSQAVYNYHSLYKKRHWNMNGILDMIESGSKGSKTTLNQMCGMVGQMYVRYSRYPFVSSHFLKGQNKHMSMYGFIRKSYAIGVSVVDSILEAHPTGESVQMKNKGVAKSGYAVRKIMMCMMGVVVDTFGRVVDSKGRILWTRYGNDGYESQCLINCKLRLMTWSNMNRYTWPSDCTSYLTASAREQWETVKDQVPLNVETLELLKLRARLGKLLARSYPLVTTIRAPFSFFHLFERCRSSVQVQKCVDITPYHYYTFTRQFWTKLLEEKFVIPSNLTFQALYLDWFSVTSLMVRWRFGLRHLRWLADQVVRLLRRALVEPGESVGIHSTQNLGEPFSQMCLKSPHLAGKFTSVIAGADRIKALVDAKYSFSQMTVVLKNTVKSRDQAELIGLNMTRCYMKEICTSTDIKVASSQVLITFHVSRQKTIRRMVSLRAVVKRWCNDTDFTFDMFDVSFMDESKLFIRLRIQTDEKCWSKIVKSLNTPNVTPEIVAANIAYNLTHTYVIHGNPSLENFVVEQVNYGTTKRWTITTLGSDLRYALRLPKVDTRRTTSTDIPEMCKVFGLYAARKCLENEFLSVLSNLADPRHIKLIARRMAYNLTIQGMKIQQSGRDIPALQRAAYEKAVQQMVIYCADAEQDHGKTLASGLLMNKLVAVGTGYQVEIKPYRQSHDPISLSTVSSVSTPKPTTMCKYVFSPKIDGTRYYFVMFRNRQKRKLLTLISRNCRMFAFDTTGLDENFFEGTIMDGELAQLKDGSYGFFVFDCLLSCGNKCSVLRYDQRLEVGREVVHRLGRPSGRRVDFGFQKSLFHVPISLRPRVSREFYQMGVLPFPVIVKPVFDVAGVATYTTNVVPTLPFKTDGMVFTNLYDPAYPFRMRDTSIFKWKSGVHNTIDITIHPKLASKLPMLPTPITNTDNTFVNHYRNDLTGGKTIVSMFVGQFYFSDAFVSPEVELQMGQTYECKWSLDSHTWTVIRHREKSPNHWTTVVNTLQNLVEDIKVSEFCQ